MNRWNLVLVFATAVLLGGCGGSGGTGDSIGTTDPVGLATKMITEATSEDCPTQQHCVPWPVESLAAVSEPDDERTLDL